MTPHPFDAAPGPVLTPTLPATPTPFVPNRGGLPAAAVDGSSAVLPWAEWSLVQWAGLVLLVVLVALVTVVSVRRIVRRLYVVREHEELGRHDLDGPVLPAAHGFTAVVTADGPAGLAVTLDLLARQDHPDVRVVVAVDPGDRLALEVARSAERRHPERVRVGTVPAGDHRPSALGGSLVDGVGRTGTGIVGLFSAGDRPHPRLFSLVDSVLTRTGADAVQHAGRPALASSPWWLPRVVVDRWWWSRSIVRAHDRAGFVPLSDDTLFVRDAWFAGDGGWDASFVEAGLDLGVRMTVAGARIVVATSTDTTTVERSPRGPVDLVRSRASWARGCLQVLGAGDWRGLRPRARRRALDVLTEPLVDAAVTLVTATTVVSTVAVGAPLLVVLVALLPVVPAVVGQVLDVGATTEAASEQGRRATTRERLLVVLGGVADRLVTLVAVVVAVGTELAAGRPGVGQPTVGPAVARVPGRPSGADEVVAR